MGIYDISCHNSGLIFLCWERLFIPGERNGFAR
jgi:hypothetical protein